MPDVIDVSVSALDMVLCYLHNHFPVRDKAKSGRFVVASGAIANGPELMLGQYYVVAGSVFNDGLHRAGDGDLVDEIFPGVVMPCAVPRAVQELAAEIDTWRAKNPETDKQSESFGGYSCSRGGAGTASSGWTAAFASRLNAWRKPYEYD